MSIRHHLNDNLLMAYSAGILPEAFELVVATHVSMCDDCRARLESFEAVGGSVLECCDEADLSDGALELALSNLDERAKEPIPAGAKAETVFPQPLRGYVGGDLDAVRWSSVGGGVRQAVLASIGDTSVRLIHIPAGTSVPDHGHGGNELTVVLKGAFRDVQDRFARGDVEVADQALSHTPVAEDGEDCICLTATDAPLKFKGWLPRLAQPFIGI